MRRLRPGVLRQHRPVAGSTPKSRTADSRARRGAQRARRCRTLGRSRPARPSAAKCRRASRCAWRRRPRSSTGGPAARLTPSSPCGRSRLPRRRRPGFPPVKIRSSVRRPCPYSRSLRHGAVRPGCVCRPWERATRRTRGSTPGPCAGPLRRNGVTLSALVDVLELLRR